MSFSVVNTVLVLSNNELVESSDLTRSLASCLGSEMYIVVMEGQIQYVLSLSNILTATSGLNLSNSVATGLNYLLTDQFIAEFEVDHIPVTTDKGIYTKKLVAFSPLSYKDFVVEFTSVNTPDVSDDLSRKGFLDDLRISGDRDLSNSLVSVNGVFHQTRFLDGKLYVLDGFRTIRISGKRDVQLIDTSEIGGHTIVPLTTKNVSSSAYNQPALVNVGMSLVNKTVFAVIDGYFYHLPHNVVRVADETHVYLETNKMPLLQQWRHNPRTMVKPDRYGDLSQSSRKYLDHYDQLFLTDKTQRISTFENAAFQYSRLTAYHSFLVVVDNGALFTHAIPIVSTDTPRMYSDPSDRSLSGMMNYGCGLSPSYVIWKDDKHGKIVFVGEQDGDVDWIDSSINAQFVTSIIPDQKRAARTPVQMIDYISA